LFRLGSNFHVQNGQATRFWLDWWWGNEPLATKSRALFDCQDPSLLVYQALSNPGMNIKFCRALSPEDLAVWDALLTGLEPCSLSEGHDKVSRALEPSGEFLVNSMYKRLLQGAAWPCAKIIWKSNLP
jgi:hypothetical protein